jgi:hypothetical protein
MSNKDFQSLEAIYQSYGLSSENELYQYMAESFLNGQLKQAKTIFSELREITTMQYNYVEKFSKNLDIWFGSDGSKPIKNFFKINN